MKTYILLLRGVMPYGKNKTPMAELRKVLSEAGFKNVRTWIQSGNVVLQSGLSPRELEKTTEALIKDKMGPDLTVLARTPGQIEKILEENPFKENYDLSRVFFTLFKIEPQKELVETMTNLELEPEEAVFSTDHAYLYVPGNYTKGKVNNNMLEKKLKVRATTRNFNTLNKLVEMSKE